MEIQEQTMGSNLVSEFINDTQNFKNLNEAYKFMNRLKIEVKQLHKDSTKAYQENQRN